MSHCTIRCRAYIRYVIAIFREIRGSTRAILPQSKERPRGSRASSGTAVEDCSIHGQDNSAKGAREKRMRRSAPHSRRSKVHMYLRVWRSDGPRLCIFGKTSAYIFERGGARTGGWTRLFPPRDRSKGGLLEAIIEAPLYTCAPFLSLLLRSLSLSLSLVFFLYFSLTRPRDHSQWSPEAAVDLDGSASLRRILSRLVINLDTFLRPLRRLFRARRLDEFSKREEMQSNYHERGLCFSYRHLF